MAMVCQCNNCKAIIEKDDIKIHLLGYKVSHNSASKNLPMGYGVEMPEDFCSFNCLSEWANEQQKVLDDYKEFTKEKGGA